MAQQEATIPTIGNDGGIYSFKLIVPPSIKNDPPHPLVIELHQAGPRPGTHTVLMTVRVDGAMLLQHLQRMFP